MPKFLNTLRHRVYVQDPEKGLVRVGTGQEVDATGAFADSLENTPGIVKAGSDEAKAAQERFDRIPKEPPPVPVVEESAREGSATVTSEDVPKAAPKKAAAKKSAPKRSARKKSD